MTDRSVFPGKPEPILPDPFQPPEKPQDAPAGPLVALGWLAVLVAVACAPAVVWAVWRWAL